MKTLAPLVLLMCCLCHIFAAPAVMSMSRDGCCPGHNRTRIPKKFVENVCMTLSNCKPKSMIITTVNNMKFCIDPDWDWAKKLLATFEKPSAIFNQKKCPKKLQDV